MAELKGVEVFDTGTNNGIRFEDDDLDVMVRGFEEQSQAGKLPVKIGHTDDDTAPAMGWIENLYKKGSKLLADLSQVPDELIERIKEGRLRHVSVELLRNVTTRDGKSYDWLLDGLAILGAARPAVESLAGLHTLFQRGTPGVRFAERLSFSRANDNEAETLRTENRRLQEQLLRLAQDTDVTTGRVVAAERVRFDRRYRDAPDGRTVENWRAWVADVPRPTFNRPRTAGSGGEDSRNTMSADARPDVELAALAKAEVEKSGGRLTFSQASIKVMEENPELANRYRFFPGVKDQ